MFLYIGGAKKLTNNCFLVFLFIVFYVHLMKRKEDEKKTGTFNANSVVLFNLSFKRNVEVTQAIVLAQLALAKTHKSPYSQVLL